MRRSDWLENNAKYKIGFEHNNIWIAPNRERQIHDYGDDSVKQIERMSFSADEHKDEARQTNISLANAKR